MFQPQKRKEKAVEESEGNDDLQFCWGLRKGVITHYESFTLDNTEYTLYDCVYIRSDGEDRANIGKLVRIWESESHEKKVEVVWFFRPMEIVNWLGDVKPHEKEIFLACGQGKGLSCRAPLEAISGKCNVVCSSMDKNNPQPTERELRMAEYIFYRTFDVGNFVLSDKFPSSICRIEVGRYFNMRKDTQPSVFGEPKAHLKVSSEARAVKPMENVQSSRLEKVPRRFSAPIIPASRHINNSTKVGPSDVVSSKKGKLPVPLVEGPRGAAQSCPPSRDFRHERPNAMDSFLEKKLVARKSLDEREYKHARKSLDEKEYKHARKSLDGKEYKHAEKGVGSKQHIGPAINYKCMEVTRNPGTDSCKWLKLEVWSEERLREMNEKGTLVLLENLDPTFTSAEVEDIVWRVFEQKVKAKMVQYTTSSSPHSGQALTILKTKEAADYVISRLKNGCLVLGDGRCIVGRRPSLRKTDLSVGFCGHLKIDRTRPWRQREAMRNAVATSHLCQSNTIEFELAMQWRLLQEKSDLWWTALHTEQGKAIEALMKRMKTHIEKCESYIQERARRCSDGKREGCNH